MLPTPGRLLSSKLMLLLLLLWSVLLCQMLPAPLQQRCWSSSVVVLLLLQVLLLLLLLVHHSICYELPKACRQPRVCVQEQALSSTAQGSADSGGVTRRLRGSGVCVHSCCVQAHK